MTLKKISKVTGGKYFRATDIEALEAIYSEINELERSEIDVNEYSLFKELYSWFLIPAVFLSTILFIIKQVFFRMVD